jgi:adenylate kinase
LLRKEMAAKTKLGLEAQSIIAAGGLVSDEIIVQIIEKTITDNPGSSGFLFDGFPRTYIQAYILEGLMLKLHTSLNCLISLNVPEEESVRRLMNRGMTSGRSDDNETVIRNRLKEYNQKTLPVLQFYRDKGIYVEVDGTAALTRCSRRFPRSSARNSANACSTSCCSVIRARGAARRARRWRKNLASNTSPPAPCWNRKSRPAPKPGSGSRALYENGQLVPDEIVVQLIEKRLADSKDVKGFIFKGFPRTLVQSYILDGLLQKHGSSISKIMEIEVPTLELIRRLDERSKTAGCMPYDNSTSKIVKRLHEHETKTVPVITKYNERTA